MGKAQEDAFLAELVRVAGNQVMTSLNNSMVDPWTVVWGAVWANGGRICGAFNPRDSAGAYVGFKRFVGQGGGRVLIDGTDARELRVDDLRRNIGIVFQESFLFSHTIAANIAFGRPEATREQIELAARMACAHEFIERLPDGYDSVLGEGGMDLSGGQRQRLAIARAVLLDPAILLLDDPAAAIDPHTEQEILSAMQQAMQGRTTFVVAHRLSTLRHADVVLVLEEGRIAQRGTHAELMDEPGHYRQAAEVQGGVGA